MKPFIKPRPATPAKAPEPPAPARISPNELTIFGMASTLNDAAERQAYLDRACAGDADLRARIEGRLASRGPALPPAQPTPAQLVKTVRENSLTTTNAAGERHDAVALVPMSAMQLANSQGPPRHSPVPWTVATILAVIVGALAVFFLNEKKDREQAERESTTATAAAAEAEREKNAALTEALDAKTAAQRSGTASTDAERLKAAAEAETKRAQAEAAQSKTEREQALAAAKAAVAKEQAAQAEAANLRRTSTETQRATSLALADSLLKLAVLQSDSRPYLEAEAAARQCLDLRTKATADGWSIVEAQTILGTILVRRKLGDEAKVNLLGAGEAMEKLPPPANDADRARLTAASKRVFQFYKDTEHRKEGEAWKKRIDDRFKPPAP